MCTGALLFVHTGRDDTYISYWPAQTLVEQGALLNYNGDAVEQSSSLLYVLLLALAYGVTRVELPVLGVVLSVLAALAVLGVQARWSRRGPAAKPSASSPAAASPAAMSQEPAPAAVWLTATQPFFLYWAFSGMETALAALALLLLCLAWSAWLDARTPRAGPALAVAGATAAVLMVRPEGMAVIAVTLLAEGAHQLRARRHQGRRRAEAERAETRAGGIGRLAPLALTAGVLYAGLAAFRWLYFGSVQPQPVVAKVAPLGVEIVVRGLGYLERTFTSNPLMPLLGAVLLITLGHQAWRWLLARDSPAWARLALCLCLAHLGFAILTGGDWMELGRFLAPAMPLAALLVASTAGSLVPAGRPRRLAVVALIALQMLAVAGASVRRSAGLDALSAARFVRHFGAEVEAQRYSFFERSNLAHLRDIPTAFHLDRVLAAATADRAEPVTVMSGQMGLVVYSAARRHYGRVRFIDVRGLATREFTDCEITARLPKTAAGLMIVHRYYLRTWARLEAECGFTPPDVIADLLGSEDILATLERAGYRVVYRQRRPLQPRGGWLAGDFGGAPLADRYAGRKMPTGQFIAVREELAEELGLTPVLLNVRSLYR